MNQPRLAEPSSGDPGETGWGVFLLVVCLAILFANMGGAALFEPDEGRNAEKARELLLLNDWVTPHHNFLPTLDKPMAYYWPVALSFKLFGLSEWAARLPSALAALGCLVLVYRFARRQWGTASALWSALVLATSIEFFLFARLAILDMSLTFFLTWALCSFYSLVRADDSRSRLLYSALMYMSIGAGTLIKGPIAIVLPGMVIFFYLLVTGRWSLLRRLSLMRGALIGCAVVAPWYLLAELSNPGYLRYFLLEEHVLRYLTPEFNRSGGWYYFFFVLAIGSLPWVFLLPQAAKAAWRRFPDPLSVFIAFWVIVPFVFFSVSKSKLPQYILPIYPAVALLTGRYLAERFGVSGRRAWPVLTLPWLFSVSVVAYLIAGASWPAILAPQIRQAVVQDASALAVSGVLLLLIAAIFINRRGKTESKVFGDAYVCTAAGLAVFFFLVGRLMIVASAERASRELTQTAAPFIDAADRVAFYDTYPTGVAFYLDADKPLWVVQREGRDTIMGSNYLALRRPAAAGDRGQVVFSFNEFARQWNRSDLILKVFVKEKNFSRMTRDVASTPRVLTKFDEYLLVTNR